MSVLLAVVLVLSGVEVYLRKTGYEPVKHWYPGERKSEKNSGYPWVYDHPAFGWVFKPNDHWQYSSKWDGFSVAYETNAEGFREKKPVHAPKTRKRVLAVGDSFTFGWGVEEHERFTNEAEKILGPDYEIYNISVPGWGFDQIYLAYKEYAARLGPDLVLVVYTPDDLLRSLTAFREWDRHTKPLLESKDGKIVERTRGAGLFEKLLRESFALNYLYKGWFLSAHKRHLNTRIADDLVRLAAEKETPVLFVKIPYKVDVLHRILFSKYQDEEEGILSGHLMRKGIPFIDTTEPLIKAARAESTFPFLSPLDFHLNPFGHKVVAQVLAERIKKILPSGAPQTASA